jgi:hypothetical protein
MERQTLSGQTSDTKNVSVVDSYAVALTFFDDRKRRLLLMTTIGA